MTLRLVWSCPPPPVVTRWRGLDEATNMVLQTAPLTPLAAIVGPRGPVGPTGGEPYVHTQTSAAATWTVNHNRGRKPPAVEILSTGGQSVMATIIHLNDNQLQIEFALPFTGTAHVI